VQAVKRCDDRELPAPGPVTQKVAEIWAQKERENLDP
jgi:branched-chain amino acid aminotransferase